MGGLGAVSRPAKICSKIVPFPPRGLEPRPLGLQPSVLPINTREGVQWTGAPPVTDHAVNASISHWVFSYTGSKYYTDRQTPWTNKTKRWPNRLPRFPTRRNSTVQRVHATTADRNLHCFCIAVNKRATPRSAPCVSTVLSKCLTKFCRNQAARPRH